jgi:predicted transposase YdaD
MVDRLKEKIMDATRSLESPWITELREELSAIARVEGRAEGKQDALLMVLGGRGLPLSAAQRRAIRDCADVATLDRWLAGAGNAASVAELLAPAMERKKRRSARA